MRYKKILSKLGLSEWESSVYLDLLEHGTSSIVDISNRTGIHRPMLYKILPLLVETWLISSVIRWKRKYFKSESPEHLKNLFEKLSTSFNSIIPDLEDMYASNDARPNIQVLEWKKWIRQIFEDVVVTLKKNDVYYRYSSRVNFWGKFLPTNYYEQRDKKNIERYVITSESRAKSKQSKPNREVVYIPSWFDLFDENVGKLIYWNKIAIIDYNTLTSFIIENRLLAKFEEKIFKSLFRFLRQMQDGE
ncbi:MAG: Transcriptional regulator, TrmB [uncultured bacterium (gcode 4)]|uniref:Transcriptional regulator, TrmB n=1 Tax=uncultured bacterium (gcode 4) TaxID=1234023 RepID=K2GBI2_9BACT|nr:MAG: Transcriptional regulator, TrmB [uncultured bacterium (gcode 4)]